MRLFKLLAYALLGYAIYEFVRGMLDEPDTKPLIAPRSAPPTMRQHQTSPAPR